MRRASLSGERRKMVFLLGPLQRQILEVWVPKVPMWLNSTHLVLLTIPSCIGVVVSGYLARQNIWWILGISLFILIQFITDALDGAVGRYRKEGYILWGFYMDHFMDYCFACSLVAAFSLAYQLSQELYFLASLITSGVFIHEYLVGVVKGEINTEGYYGLGTTELRLVMILVTLVLPLVPARWVTIGLTMLIPLSLILLAFLVFRAQLRFRQWDRRKKRGDKIK